MELKNANPNGNPNVAINHLHAMILFILKNIEN